MAEALNCSPGNSLLPEILLNFSRFKGKRRLTLAQNPHFYGDLPTSDSPTRYVAGFNSHPTDCYTGTIYVVTNNSRRVFLEFGETRQAFDNVSVANNTLIFKGWFRGFLFFFFPPLTNIISDISGKLQGEAIVGGVVGGAVPDMSHFWYRMEPTQDHPAMTGTTTDWMELIRNLGDSPHIHIRISATEFVIGRF